MAPIKFNNQDLLSKVRLEVINPLVDSYGVLTLDVSKLKGNVAGLSKRLGFIEPQVDSNSKNLTALNQFARAVAQQVTMTYDKSRVNSVDKRIIFTTVGGVESTLDLSPMFIDPLRSTIEVSKDDGNPFPADQLDFKGNITVSRDPENVKKAHILIPFTKAKIGTKEDHVTKIELTGNVGSSSIEDNTLKINLEEASGNGLFIDPAPAVVGINHFKSGTKDDAEEARDDYFKRNQSDFDTYKKNHLKMIIIEWSDFGVETQFQVYVPSVGKWVNPFDVTFEEFLIGQHSIDELKDGNRVANLEGSVITKLTSVGVGVDLINSRTAGEVTLRKIDTSADSTDLEIVTNPTVDSGILFKTKPHWRGYYETLNAATAAIPPNERITNKTTIISKNPESEHSLHVWNGTTWEDKRIAEHSFISEDNSNWMTLEGLGVGPNIKFTKVTNPTGGYYHKIEALPTLSGKIDGGTDERIHYIEVSNRFAHLSNGVLKLPVISAVSRAAGMMGQIKNIKQGENVSFDVTNDGILTIGAEIPDPIKVRTPVIGFQNLENINDPCKYSHISSGTYTPHHIGFLDAAGASGGHIRDIKAGENITLKADLNGVLTISSTGGGGVTPVPAKIEASVGATGTYVPIERIHSTSEFSEISDKTLKIHAIDCKDFTDTELGQIKTLKAGANVTFDYSKDPATKGVLTISSTGGGSGGTPLQAKVSGGEHAGKFLPITKIELVSDLDKSEIIAGDASEYTMKFDTRATMLSVDTFDQLETTYPAKSHANRFCIVEQDLEVYFTEGIKWGLATYSGMSDQVKSLFDRYPEFQSGSAKYDPDDARSGYMFVDKESCPLVGDVNKEPGILQNISISKFKRSQFYFGLEKGTIWYRVMNPTTTSGAESDFMGWRILNAMSDEYFSILTTPSHKLNAASSEVAGIDPLPLMVIQDAKCNVMVDTVKKSFEIQREGMYDITVCAHITADAETLQESWTVGAQYTFILEDSAGKEISRIASSTNVKTPSAGTYKGYYPPVRMTFHNVTVGTTNSFKIKVLSSRNVHLTNVYLDSYKNYVVIQPSVSATKHGVTIADNLRTSLGGFSCKPGYEVHIEGHKSAPATVRVFGSLINDTLVTR